MAKGYMFDFYMRNLVNNNTTRTVNLPAYLLNFTPTDQSENQELMEFFKSGDYDMKKEEALLDKLRKSIGQVDVDKVGEMVRYLGLTGVYNKNAEMSEAVLEARRQRRARMAVESIETARFREFSSAITEEVDQYLENLLALAGTLDTEFKTSQLSRRLSEISQDLVKEPSRQRSGLKLDIAKVEARQETGRSSPL